MRLLYSFNQPFACFVFACTLTASIIWARRRWAPRHASKEAAPRAGVGSSWALALGVGWACGRSGPRRWPLCVPSPDLQGAPKKKKKTGVPTYLPFLRFFEIFRSDFRKYFYGVFGLLMQRNGQKRDKFRWEKTKGKKNLNFFGQKLLT
jgi:hypothetical protein